MTRLGKLLRLPPHELRHLCHASLLLLTTELLLRLWPFPAVLDALRRRCERTPRGSPPADPGAFAHWLDVADRHGLLRPSCLRKSVALAWWLGGCGIRAAVKIGVAKDADRLQAHAWLDVEAPIRRRFFEDTEFVDLRPHTAAAGGR